MDRLNKKKLITGFICIIVLGLSLLGGGNAALSVWNQNVRILNPSDNKELPIYCVDTKKKEISLTFDTAWGNEDIDQILKLLKKENVKASFFFSGDWVQRFPGDVKKIAKAGHDIGNHGDNHKYMTKLSSDEQKKEILGAHSKVQAVTGEQMVLFRPPYGDYDETVVKTARELNYEVIQWSVDSLDWKDISKQDIIKRVCDNKKMENGAIILMHTGTVYTKQALPVIIQRLKPEGYRFVPVSQMILTKNFYIDPEGKQRRK